MKETGASSLFSSIKDLKNIERLALSLQGNEMRDQGGI